jgi:alkanesulfonate monooxygenase SsuD/methylene tetrahydromethanopterin reductase-like flavin-dependent oxidoreductase (luciferase family)
MNLPIDILLPLLPTQNARMAAVLGKRAEDVRYHGVWVPETAGLDGVSLLAALAGQISHPAIAYVIWTAVAEDSEGFRSWLKTNISGYMLAMAPYRQAIRDNGFARAVRQLEEARRRGDRNEAREAVPDELIEQMVMFGARDRILRGLRLLIEAGADRVLLMPITSSKDGATACLPTPEAFAPGA